MLWKTFEFKNVGGQKIKIIEIPVLEDDYLLQQLIEKHLEIFIEDIVQSLNPNSCYSFRNYLKKRIKWSVYESLLAHHPLPSHA